MTEWRSLDWLPDYEISESGDIRRRTPFRGTRVGRLRSTTVNSYGYVRLIIANRGYQVHRLVCEAWHGPPPSPKAHCAHNDGNKLNNHYSNLRWATASENSHDRWAHGTMHCGDRAHCAKLDWPTVRKIRASYRGERGEVMRLCRQHGVTSAAMSKLLRGRTWKPQHDPANARSPLRLP